MHASDDPGTAPVQPTTARRAQPAAPPKARVLLTLSMLMGFSSISTALYLPALPSMAAELHGDAYRMAQTISGFLLGFSLGQLVWGPLGDRHGRRAPMAAGLVLYMLGSMGCALSQSAEALIAWRVVQAAGACAGVVLARAMVRDLYAGPKAASMLSSLMTVMAIAPLLGPTVGGQILAHASWRALFWVLAAVGALALGALLTLPETLPVAARRTAPMSAAAGRYMQLLRSRAIVGHAGAGGCFYGGMYAYLAGTPFAYIEYYRVAPTRYGLLFALGVLGLMGTNALNARLVGRLSPRTLVRTGTALAAASGLWAAAAGYTGLGGLIGLVVPLLLFVSTAGLIVANTLAGAMAISPRDAGAISALVGAIHYGIGIVGSLLVGALADGTPGPLGLVMLMAGAGASGCAWFVLPAPNHHKNRAKLIPDSQ